MNGVMIFEGGPSGNDPRVEASDVVQNLSSSLIPDSAKGALVTVEGASVRFAYAYDPSVSPQKGHLLENGDVLEIRGAALLRRFRFINAVPGEGAVLQVTVLA